MTQPIEWWTSEQVAAYLGTVLRLAAERLRRLAPTIRRVARS